MFAEHIRCRMAALLIVLLPAGLAGCATAGAPGWPPGPHAEESAYFAPPEEPFLNEPLFGYPPYEYAAASGDYYVDGIGGPELYPGGPGEEQSLLSIPPPSLPPTGWP